MNSARALRLVALAVALLVVAGCAASVRREKERIARLRSQGKYEAARTALDRLARFSPRDTGVLALQVKMRSAERRFPDAVMAYRRYFASARGHDPQLLDTLVFAAFHDGSTTLGCRALRVAAALELPYADSLAREGLGLEPEMQVEALAAVGRSHSPDAADWVVGEFLAEESEVRLAAVMAAQRLGDPRNIHLSAIMSLDPNDYTRWRTVLMRAELGDPGHLRQVREELTGGYEMLEIQAAACLARRGERALLGRVAEGLKSDDPDIRTIAAGELGLSSAAEYSADLAALASDNCPSVRDAAAAALCDIGDKTTLATLISMLNDPDADVRATATTALGRLGTQSDESFLVAQLADSSPQVGVSAVGALRALCAQPAPSEPPQH